MNSNCLTVMETLFSDGMEERVSLRFYESYQWNTLQMRPRWGIRCQAGHSIHLGLRHLPFLNTPQSDRRACLGFPNRQLCWTGAAPPQGPGARHCSASRPALPTPLYGTGDLPFTAQEIVGLECCVFILNSSWSLTCLLAVWVTDRGKIVISKRVSSCHKWIHLLANTCITGILPLFL